MLLNVTFKTLVVRFISVKLRFENLKKLAFLTNGSSVACEASTVRLQGFFVDCCESIYIFLHMRNNVINTSNNKATTRQVAL